MTDFASLLVADRGQKARPIHLVDKDGFAAWLKKRPAEDRALLEAQRFDGENRIRLCAAAARRRLRGGQRGQDRRCALPVVPRQARRKPARRHLPARRASPASAALGWLLGQHRFDPYRSKKDEPERGPRVLLTGEPARIDETVRLAEATALVRDLVNTPAGDLGPAELEAAVRDEAEESRRRMCAVTTGDELAKGYPLIAAVGGGGDRANARRG